jgi:uncharacterized membrane protein
MRLSAEGPWRRTALIAGCVVLAGIVAGSLFLIFRPGGRTVEAQAAVGGTDTKAVGGSGNGRGGGLRLCKKTSSQVGIALGFKDMAIWTTSGWWNIPTYNCETIVAGPLESRFYYIYAVDYDRGGAWSGPTIMCTRDKLFMIQGIEDCVARGYERTGFFEIDTGEQKNWTVQLTEPTHQGADAR